MIAVSGGKFIGDLKVAMNTQTLDGKPDHDYNL